MLAHPTTDPQQFVPSGYIPCLHVPTAETPAGLYLKLESLFFYREQASCFPNHMVNSFENHFA